MTRSLAGFRVFGSVGASGVVHSINKPLSLQTPGIIQGLGCQSAQIVYDLLVIVDQFSNSIARSFAAKTVNIFRAIMMMIFIIIMQH